MQQYIIIVSTIFPESLNNARLHGMDLLELSASVSLSVSSAVDCHLIKSQCSYFHYLCDGTDDRVR